MFRRSLKWVFAHYAAADADRLIRLHGSDAIFVARHAVSASREDGGGGHWTRVLAEVEARIGYRPW